VCVCVNKEETNVKNEDVDFGEVFVAGALLERKITTIIVESYKWRVHPKKGVGTC